MGQNSDWGRGPWTLLQPFLCDRKAYVSGNINCILKLKGRLKVAKQSRTLTSGTLESVDHLDGYVVTIWDRLLIGCDIRSNKIALTAMTLSVHGGHSLLQAFFSNGICETPC